MHAPRHITYLAAAALAVAPACGNGAPGGPESPPAGSAPVTAGTASADRAPAAPRDPAMDRQLTASAEAYAAYEQGVALSTTLPVQAAARFRRALGLDPAFAPAGYRLALVSTMLSHEAEARRGIDAALAAKEHLPDPYRTAAVPLSHFIQGAFDLANASLDDALAANPSDPDLHYLAGMLASCSCEYFDPDETIAHLELAIDGGLDTPFVRDRLMDAYELKGMTNYALNKANERLATHPDMIEAISEVGRVRIARGEYADAIEAADEVVRRGEDVFVQGLAPAFLLTGQHEQIAAMYDPDTQHDSAAANLITHLHAGLNDVYMGRFSSAERHFERGAEFAPAPWESNRKALFYLLAGRVRAVQGRHREAASALEAAQQAGGAQPVLEYALGLNHLQSGEPALAQRVVNRLAKESHRSRPGWTEPWRRLMVGEMALASGQATRAVDDLRDAWNLERPLAVDCVVSHADAYFLDALGRAYLAARRPEDALQAFEQIRALGIRGLNEPVITVMALYYSGAALDSLGRKQEARRRLMQFVYLWGKADSAASRGGGRAQPPQNALGGLSRGPWSFMLYWTPFVKSCSS